MPREQGFPFRLCFDSRIFPITSQDIQDFLDYGFESNAGILLSIYDADGSFVVFCFF